MNNNSYNLFEKQLKDTCRAYPNLRIKEREGFKYLQGTIDIYNTEGISVATFLVEIHFSEGFPYRFPILYEIGGAIPNHIDWHKYSDGSCCITVKPDEIFKCRNGITIIDFIKLYVIPYLANQYHKIEFGHYLNEYSHGSDGLAEYYSELICTNDKMIWLRCFRLAFGDDCEDKLKDSRCFCGSGLQYMYCHKETISHIRIIGKENIISNMQIISIVDSLKEKVG